LSDYDTDIVAWAEDQARLLRRRAAGELVNDAEFDWTNIAEEIEDVAGRHRQEIRSRLAVLCTHLLKWTYQPSRRSRSWRGSIVDARDEIADLIGTMPTLRNYPAGQLAGAYARGRRRAEAETGIEMPEDCPWTIQQVLDQGFWPPPPGPG
jgi:hypothetical protein